MTGWQYACPEGHVTIRTRGNSVHSPTETPYVACKTCRCNGEDYKYTHKIDRRTGEEVAP
jgi:hypothetical protein